MPENGVKQRIFRIPKVLKAPFFVGVFLQIPAMTKLNTAPRTKRAAAARKL